MDEINFNSLEFNLYELLNLPTNCTIEDVKKKFRKLIKQFHPDKITTVEEKIYYNITVANHILGNEESRKRYDMWLLGSHKSHSSLKDGFQDALAGVQQYFPQSKEEAAAQFQKDMDDLANRHGAFKEDKRKLHDIYKEKERERGKVNIAREDFSSMDDFNNKFAERKKNGLYCDKIVKRNNEIQPFTFGSSSNYAELKDFHNVYKKDSQIQYAFQLMPVADDSFNDKSMKERMDEYNNMTNMFKKEKPNILDGLDF
jgi:curved DNA-binding protein CbpA